MRRYPVVGRPYARKSGDPPAVWISEAIADLYGWQVGERVKLLEDALNQKLAPQESAGAVQSLAMLGTVDLPDAIWAQNVYGLAFGTGRQFQLGIDGKSLAKELAALTDADLQALAKDVFSAEKRSAVIVEIGQP